MNIYRAYRASLNSKISTAGCSARNHRMQIYSLLKRYSIQDSFGY